MKIRSGYYQVDEAQIELCWLNDPRDVFELPIPKPEYGNQGFIREFDDRNHSGRESWFGTGCTCHGDVYDLIDYGWERGRDRGVEVMGEIEAPMLPSLKRKRRRGPAGFRFDIHQAYAGRLDEAWDVMKREGVMSRNMKKTNVNIMVDISGHARRTEEEFFWRGALANTLSDALTRSGRSVRVIAYSVATDIFIGADNDTYDRLVTATLVKDWNMPLELNKLYAITALAGYYRTIVFNAMSRFPKARICSSLGYPAQLLDREFDYLSDSDESCINIKIDNIYSQADAVAMLDNFMRKMES